MLSTDGRGNLRSAASSVWGPKALDGILDVDLDLEVEVDSVMARREGVEPGWVKLQSRVLYLLTWRQISSGESIWPDIVWSLGSRQEQQR